MGTRGPRMQPPAAKDAGRRDSRDRASKGTQGAESPEEHAKGAPAGELPMPGWTLKPEALADMHPAQCHRHLLFCDLPEDVGAAASIFPRESVELGYRMPDLRAWTKSLELPAARQDRLLGVLKAAEACGRIRALRLRYNHLRAEEISLLIQRQKSARAAIRLELFLPPQLKPTRIPDPLDRQEVPASPGRRGERAPPSSLHTWPQPLSPAAEALGDHPGGDSGWPHLPALTATPPAHIKFSFSKSLLVFTLRLHVPGQRRRGWMLPLRHRTSQTLGYTEWSSSNKVGSCKWAGVINREPGHPSPPQIRSLQLLSPWGAGRRMWLSKSHPQK
ncbi:protein LKAAEAR1 isoform X2 [Rhinolophus ferrumequinum]|uniref:protein LKAAEAR1 isoform X2 n=1 Tax=Rhinolophus ferrumequinum TaxID=59479 RepID=UPI00140FF6F6|nr:protein LKAAEAR1 isoform X2 [Rhinolophus ferrumequinum]